MNDSNMCTIGTRNTVKSSQYPEELEDKRPSKRKRSRKSNDTITTNSESPCKTLQRRPGQIPEFEETNIRIKVEENYALKKRVHFQLDELDEKQTQSKPFMRPKSTVELRKSASLSKTLPFLLLQREQGIKSLKFWKSRMLQSDDSNGKGEHLSSNQGKNWRPYCYRRIPFTELGTPASDAILALDPSGSYMISVGGRSEFNPNHSDEMEERMRKEEQGKGMEVISLALRFYGLPLSRVHRDSYQSREKLNSMSPLLLTIPIAYQDNHASQQPLNEYRYNNSGIVGNSMSAGFGPNWDIDLLAPPPALFPIRIWTSSDGILGAVLARLWHHEGWIGCANQARLIIFPLPGTLSKADFHTPRSFIHTMFLDKIQVDRMGLQKPSEDANLLWNVTFVPCNNRDYTHTSTLENNDPWNSKKCKLLCNVIKEIPAYLFILDEEDGYRLNWISLYHYRADQTKNKTVGQNVHRKENSVKWNKVENLVVSMNDCDTGWRDCWSDRQTGLKAMLGPDHSTTPSISNEKALHVAFTAFLSMTALLQDILLRYPKFLKHSKTKAYNGCSIDSEQHQRSIPIIPNYTYDVVSVTEGGQMIEVLLVFSAPDQSCWYKKSIQQNEEYKSKSVGVFILIDLITQDYMELSWLKSNYSIDDDLVQICRLALGRRRHSLTSTGTTNSIQHDIAAPLELLYPDCQAIDNIAVRQQRPVLSIKARSSPIELYYG